MKDYIGSIFWIMVGIYVAVHSYILGLDSLRHPGPGFIFFLSALLLIILGSLDLAVTFIANLKTVKKEGPVWSGIRWQKILLVLVGLSAYVFFLNFGGFLPSTFLLMLFLFRGVEPTKWWIAIMNSLITTSASYLIFRIWLKVPLPLGVLGF